MSGVAIVGAAESDEVGKLPGKSALMLHAEAAHNALEDAGLSVKDVDAVLASPGSISADEEKALKAAIEDWKKNGSY